jgi:hypothetical protein
MIGLIRCLLGQELYSFCFVYSVQTRLDERPFGLLTEITSLNNPNLKCGKEEKLF